jgi:Na+/proline symporter
MFGLHILDIVVLILYFIGIAIIGTWAARLIKNLGDFFMPRKFGKAMIMMHAFGSGTHSDQAVGVASKTFTNGLSGIWYQWLWLFCTPFYWLIAPLMRRFRAITMSDVFEARYDRGVGMLFAVVGGVNLMVTIGIMLKGSGAIISSCLGGTVSSNVIIAIMTLLFVGYGIAGGLAAAIVTDFFQGILTIIFSFLLLPIVMNAVGGFSGLRETITDPQMFSLIAPAEIGIFYIGVITLNGLIGIVAQPHTMGNCATGKNEFDGRIGFVTGTFLKRVCTVAWCLTGLAAVAYFSGRNIHPDSVYGLMARDFLPKILPGLLGVFIASLLASMMSSCDSFMIASSALLTENVYKHLRPNLPDNHYILIGRIFSLVIVIGGVIFAFWLPGVVAGLEIFWKIPPMMGIVFWMGLFWRRATVAGAWATTISAFFMWWLTTQRYFISIIEKIPMAEQLRFVVEKSGSIQISLPWQMLFYLTIGAIVGIIVSLLSKSIRQDKLDRFYELVRTPVITGETPSLIPCTIPNNVIIPPKRKLLPFKSLEILVPNWTSTIGFVVSWGLVGLLIYVFFIIVK